MPALSGKQRSPIADAPVRLTKSRTHEGRARSPDDATPAPRIMAQEHAEPDPECWLRSEAVISLRPNRRLVASASVGSGTQPLLVGEGDRPLSRQSGATRTSEMSPMHLRRSARPSTKAIVSRHAEPGRARPPNVRSQPPGGGSPKAHVRDNPSSRPARRRSKHCSSSSLVEVFRATWPICARFSHVNPESVPS